MQVKLNKFSDLINLIEGYQLNDEQIKTLLSNSIGIYMSTIPPKAKLIDKLKAYWEKYKGGGERPLFLD